MRYTSLIFDFLRDWLRPGIHPVTVTPQGPERGEQVVLIHGLTHRAWVMRDLAAALSREGFLVQIFDYRTTRGTIGDHAEALRVYLGTLPPLPTHFVTHSMGGLVLRRLLLDPPPELNARRWVLLAVPNRGSPVATFWYRHWPWLRRLIQPLPELADTPDSAACRLPIPGRLPPFATIAADHDRLVPPHSSHLAGELDHRRVAGGHTFIMNRSETRKLLIAFLISGKFPESE